MSRYTGPGDVVPHVPLCPPPPPPPRHMNTVELQLEVTRFLHRCETAASKAAAHTPVPAATGSPSAPPTLFGGTQMKAEVACRVSPLRPPGPVYAGRHADRWASESRLGIGSVLTYFTSGCLVGALIHRELQGT